MRCKLDLGSQIKYGSVCSGIEAATVAWHHLGWQPQWFAEIDKFPSKVLKHHYPTVKNHGDFTRITRESSGAIDLLVGGTPCQSFSVAGKRAGLDDSRGHLTLEFLALAWRLRPRWIVWENVPGVLSDDGGRTLGTFLGLLGKLGYGFAYRILDAQNFGVPQRRRRVFVVGCLGDWRSAAAVLFERESLRGDIATSKKTRQDVAPTISARTKGGGGLGTDFDLDGGLIASSGNVSHCLNAGGMHRIDYETGTLIAHSLRGEGFDANEDGTGLGVPLVPIPILEAGARTGKSTDDIRAGMGIGQPGDPMFTLQSGKQHAIAFSCKDHGADAGEIAPTLRSMNFDKSHANAGGQVAIAFNLRGREDGAQAEISDVSIRRLTPLECERLQGFPDNYTLLPGNKADGPRYKALGNSMAVPVMRWIGERINFIHHLEANNQCQNY